MTKLEKGIAGRKVLRQGDGMIRIDSNRSNIGKAWADLAQKYGADNIDYVVGRGVDGRPGRKARAFEWAIVLK